MNCRSPFSVTGLAFAISVLIALSCTRGENDLAEVRLNFVGRPVKIAKFTPKPSKPTPRAKGAVIAAPTDATGMDCLLLNISGPEVAPNFDGKTFSNGITAECLGIKAVSLAESVSTAGSAGLKMRVKRGLQRNIEVLGYEGDLGANCVGKTIEELANGGDGALYVMGETTVDLNADTTLSIANEYTSSSTDLVANCADEGDVAGTRVLLFDGSSYTDLEFPDTDAEIYSLYWDGSLSRLLVGGDFTNLGGLAAADYFAKFTAGGGWEAVAPGLTGPVRAITISSGGNLYVGGEFVDVDGIPAADGIVRNTGAAWAAMDAGVGGGRVNALETAGSMVYAGGNFTSVDGIGSMNRLGAWNEGGNNWDVIPAIGNGEVFGLSEHSGTLYIAGSFDDAGAVAGADNIVKLTGGSLVIAGTGNALNGPAYAIHAEASQFFVAGNFSNVNSNALINNVAVYDGGGPPWKPLTSGILGGFARIITALPSSVGFAGDFTSAGGVAGTEGIASFQAGSWSSLGGGVTGSVTAATGNAADVYLAGTFDSLSRTRVAFRRTRSQTARIRQGNK